MATDDISVLDLRERDRAELQRHPAAWQHLHLVPFSLPVEREAAEVTVLVQRFREEYCLAQLRRLDARHKRETAVVLVAVHGGHAP